MVQLLERKQPEQWPNPRSDQWIVQSNLSWERFKKIQEGFTGCRNVRLFYLDGTVEISTVSPEHEIYKSIIGMLIEIFLVELGIEFVPTGSMDLEKVDAAAAQGDESYCLGEQKAIPDLVMEVVFSSGGPSKLARYAVLGVREVWFWEDGLFSVFSLRESGYEKLNQSELLPQMDFELLTRCVLMNSRVEAARTLRAALSI